MGLSPSGSGAGGCVGRALASPTDISEPPGAWAQAGTDETSLVATSTRSTRSSARAAARAVPPAASSTTSSGTARPAASEPPRITASGSPARAATTWRDCFQKRFATRRLVSAGPGPRGSCSGTSLPSPRPSLSCGEEPNTVARRGAASSRSHSASCVGGLDKTTTSGARPECCKRAATGAATAAIHGSSSGTISRSPTAEPAARRGGLAAAFGGPAQATPGTGQAPQPAPRCGRFPSSWLCRSTCHDTVRTSEHFIVSGHAPWCKSERAGGEGRGIGDWGLRLGIGD